MRTKIEFSRRDDIAGAVFEPVDRVVLAPYKIPPFLTTHYTVAPLQLTDEQKAWLPEAIDRCVTISFDEYQAKVVSYLDVDQAELFAGRDAWDAMQGEVLSRLESFL